MKLNKIYKSICFLCLILLSNSTSAQINNQKSSNTSTSLDFECTNSEACNLEIYNGLFDWLDGVSYSGGQVIPDTNAEHLFGAVTVVNQNDTNGNDIEDKAEQNVTSTPSGSNEIDLMKLVLKKPVPDVGGEAKLTIVSGNIKLWESPTKSVEVVPNSEGEMFFPISQLDKKIYIEVREVSTLPY